MRSNGKIVSMSIIAMAGLVICGDFQQVVAQQSANPYIVDELTQHSHLSSTPGVPRPGIKPDPGTGRTPPDLEPEMSTRHMQRTGTAIVGTRNSVSIKSTDAGIVHRPAPPSAPLSPLPPVAHMSNCVNCAIIDFINSAQGSAVGAMASGIIAGTVARKIGGHGVYSPGGHARGVPEGHGGRGHGGHDQTHYQVGVTLQDGSRQIIVVPDVTGLHRGDVIQLKDGILVPGYDNP